MSEYLLAEQTISNYRKSKLISQDLAIYLQQKLHQNDKTIVSLFKTLEWSNNEEAFLEKVSQIHLLDSRPGSNFSTETSLKSRIRPPTVIVPANRSLKNYLREANEMSAFEAHEKKEKKPLNQANLSKLKCYQDIKFESDEGSDSEDEKMKSSMNSLDFRLPKNNESKEKMLQSLTNFFKEHKESTEFPLMETQVSLDEVVEKYEIGAENKINIDEYDDFTEEEIIEEEEPQKEEKSIPVIDRLNQ